MLLPADKYPEEVEHLIHEFPNLYISFTPELCSGKYAGITRENALDLAVKIPHRIVLGTSVRGTFEKPPPEEFGESSYAEQLKVLKYFADQIETRQARRLLPRCATAPRARSTTCRCPRIQTR